VAESFFSLAHELERRGEPFATATVVRIERPTSGKPGDRAIVTLSGQLLGWVGGSCARPTVIKEGLASLSDGKSRLIRLSPEPDDRADFEGITDLSMTCFSGGTMEIFIEPNTPRRRLIVVGEQPVARTLVALGLTLGYEVFTVGEASPSEGVETIGTADEIPAKVHPLTFVVVATHGDHDELPLERVLATEAPYVGLVASRTRASSVSDYLATRGISQERLAALHSPAGLDIGARTPEEIALSIFAELVQVGRALTMSWPAPSTATAEPEESPATALDPICGMTVQVEGARHTRTHAGTRYYFCCSHCADTFGAEPEAHLG